MGRTLHWEDFTLGRLYWEDSTQRKLHTGRKVLGRHDWKDCTLGKFYWKDIWEDNRKDIWEDCTKDCTGKSVCGVLYIGRTKHLKDYTGKTVLEGLSVLGRLYIGKTVHWGDSAWKTGLERLYTGKTVLGR